MRRHVDIVAIAALVAAVAGCGGLLERDFVRPPENALQLGKTTPAELEQRFESVYHRRGSELINGVIVTTLDYMYTTAGRGPAPLRLLSLAFVEDRLVGYHFQSSFTDDNTDFDAAKLGRIKKGETTREQVIELMGRPSGMAIYPIVKEKEGSAIGYAYSKAQSGPKLYQKLLSITLNPHEPSPFVVSPIGP